MRASRELWLTSSVHHTPWVDAAVIPSPYIASRGWKPTPPASSRERAKFVTRFRHSRPFNGKKTRCVLHPDYSYSFLEENMSSSSSSSSGNTVVFAIKRRSRDEQVGTARGKRSFGDIRIRCSLARRPRGDRNLAHTRACRVR